MFRFGESEFYLFGLKVGLLNLLRNGFSFGFKKTVGKVSQPINSYTRFPEYYYFRLAIRDYIAEHLPTGRMRILDVGSPKLFGLYLASNYKVEVHLTDFSHSSMEEYSRLWHGVRDRAKGAIAFCAQDARCLAHREETFDIVYSMSVMEHVEGPCGDSHGVREMIRVLKPGGLLVLSVPFGCTYVEQDRLGFSYRQKIGRGTEGLFFQRIYDKNRFQKRILDCAAEIRAQRVLTITRKRGLVLKAYQGLNENLRGALGFVNPWLSTWMNKCQEGMSDKVESSYGGLHSMADVYGDLIFCGMKEKKLANGTESSAPTVRGSQFGA